MTFWEQAANYVDVKKIGKEKKVMDVIIFSVYCFLRKI